MYQAVAAGWHEFQPDSTTLHWYHPSLTADRTRDTRDQPGKAVPADSDKQHSISTSYLLRGFVGLSAGDHPAVQLVCKGGTPG